MKIEKNIPLRTRGKCNDKYKIVDALEVGDSILLENVNMLRSARNRAEKAHPDRKFAARKEGPKPVHLEKHRLWRIK